MLVLLKYCTSWTFIGAYRVLSQVCSFARELSKRCSEWVATQGCLGLMAETGIPSILVSHVCCLRRV